MRKPLPQVSLYQAVVPLAALIWLAPPALHAQLTLDPKAEAAVYEDAISKDLDPFTASSFLHDEPVLDWLRASDPERQARMVSQATQLKDLSDMLAAHQKYETLVDALAARFQEESPDIDAPYFGFGREPSKFVEWNGRWGVLADNNVLRKALLDFDTLNPEAKKFLTTEAHVTDAAWQKTSFLGREAALKPWAKRTLDNIKALNPKSKADWDKMQSAAGEIDPLLDMSEKRLMWDRVHMAHVAAEALDDPRLKDPQVKDLLAAAQGAGSIEDTLTKLSAVFDKLKIPNKALQSQRPTTKAEQFSDNDRKLLSTMLGTALMTQTNGTEAGKDLTAFFKAHPLTIKIMDLGAPLAEYRDDQRDFVFNERFIMDWAKGEGIKPNDLQKDPYLTNLAMLLSPVFVHEARHAEQQAWAQDKGLRPLGGQNIEVEAKGVEALFFLQKSKDPAFAKFFADSRDSSMVAREEIQLADTFKSHGAPYFRNMMMSDYYEGLPSLETLAAGNMKYYELTIKFLRAELDRRKALPQTDQNSLESTGKTEIKDFDNMAAWRAYEAQLKTSVLKQDLDRRLANRDNIVQSYRAHAYRADDFQMRLDNSRLKLDVAPPANEPPVPTTSSK